MKKAFHVRLRALEPEDCIILTAWDQIPSVWENVVYLRPLATESDRQGWVEKMVYSPGRDLVVVVENAQRSELLGLVVLYEKDLHNRQASVEVLKAADQTGEWVCQALLLMLSHAFIVLGLERVEARVRADDEIGRMQLKTVGFSEEACQRRGLWRQGMPEDLWICSILKDEFLSQQQPLWQWPYPPEA